MIHYSRFKRRASYYARAGTGRIKDIGEIAKLQLENVSDEAKIKDLYAKIGEKYYAVCGLNPLDSSCSAACDKITEIKMRVQEKKNRIRELKINGIVDDEVYEPEDI